MAIKKNKITIGITGGIAVYKICDLITLLQKDKTDIKVIMTNAATAFVPPATFETLSNNLVHIELFNEISEHRIDHISLAQWCDLFVLAPATSNTISKIANGIADNLLTTTISALPKETKVLIAPAMNTHMWNNKILQKNIEKLKLQKDKYIFIEPKVGHLACNDVGKGALAEIDDIAAMIKKICNF